MPRSPFSQRLHQLFARQLASQEGFDPSRRKFIQNTTLAAAALASGPLRPLSAMLDSNTLDKVAIVGAGAAGLAAAYQLHRHGIPFKLFEGSNRIGGRILTDFSTFAGQNQYGELGGEMINTDHHSIRAFAKQLGVEVEDFPDADQTNLRDTFYFNGRIYSEAEIVAASEPLLRAVVRDNSLIYGNAEQLPITWKCPYAAAAAKFDRMSLAEYLDSIPELETWFKEIVKIGYESDSGVPADSQSVLLLFSYFTGTSPEEFRLFGSSDETSRIKGGNSRLMNAAFEAIGGHSAVAFDHQLLRVSEKGNKIELTFENAGRAKKFSFAQVILAAPFTTLRQVEGFADSALAIDPRVMRAVRELQYGKNSKMLVGYNRRVWREAPSQATGMAISDLFALNTWEASRMESGTEGILTSYSPSQRAVDLGLGHLAQVTGDIEKIFPGTLAAFNGRVAVKNWPANKFIGGSYSSPSMGQFTTIVGCADEAQLGGRLILAGEQTAPYYFGYMEGAVESGVRAAEQIRKSRHS
ncbi:MAG: flavin monoamine oxidase family protein [Bacteriovoracia bacterium]